MLTSRHYHGCARITDLSGNDYIIVAGGDVGRYCMDNKTREWEDNAIATVSSEVFNPRTKTWSKFQDFPKPIYGGHLVEDGRGGALMVGGGTGGDDDRAIGEIIYLPGRNGTWQTTFKTLKLGKVFHVSMLIPDSFVQC